MRKVVLAMSVSLDGFVATADGDHSWVFRGIDDELMEWITGSLREADTHLLGRANYEEQARHWPNSTGEMARLMNDTTKIVFSRTLEKAEWENSRLAEGDAAEEIANLKQRPGGEISVPGGARFAQYVSRQGLVDEYRLVVHPVVLGSGMPLFTDPVDLRLLSSRVFATGAAALTYERARPQG